MFAAMSFRLQSLIREGTDALSFSIEQEDPPASEVQVPHPSTYSETDGSRVRSHARRQTLPNNFHSMIPQPIDHSEGKKALRHRSRLSVS